MGSTDSHGESHLETPPKSPAESHLARELRTQPDDWRWAAQRAAEVADLLPAAGERVAAVGCGTSLFMARAYAELRQAAGDGWTDAFPASEHHLLRGPGGYDRVVVICRSGTTSEVIEVVEELVAAGIPHVAIVATPGTPVAERAQHVILLDRVDEKSVVQTRFATTTLALLRASVGSASGSAAGAGGAAAVAAAAADAAAVVDAADDELLADLLDAQQVTFLGRGWTVGLAEEAALKLRESAQFWTESYPAMEYRHGPISIAAPGRVTWALGEVPEGLAEEVRATGGHFEHRDVDPMAELVRVHRLCLALAAARGLDPDEPRHLSRSIILS